MALLAAFETPSTMNEAVELIKVRQGQLTAEEVAHRLTKAELRRLQHQFAALQAEHLSMVQRALLFFIAIAATCSFSLP